MAATPPRVAVDPAGPDAPARPERPAHVWRTSSGAVCRQLFIDVPPTPAQLEAPAAPSAPAASAPARMVSDMPTPARLF